MKRKRYTQEYKQPVIREAEEAGNASQVPRQNEISPNLLYTWIKQSKHREWKETRPEAKKVAASAPPLKSTGSSNDKWIRRTV